MNDPRPEAKAALAAANKRSAAAPAPVPAPVPSPASDSEAGGENAEGEGAGDGVADTGGDDGAEGVDGGAEGGEEAGAEQAVPQAPKLSRKETRQHTMNALSAMAGKTYVMHGVPVEEWLALLKSGHVHVCHLVQCIPPRDTATRPGCAMRQWLLLHVRCGRGYGFVCPRC